MTTMEPPLSALLIVIFLLFVRLWMASCSGSRCVGFGVLFSCAVLTMDFMLVVSALSCSCAGVGGVQLDLVWNCGEDLCLSLKKYSVCMRLMDCSVCSWSVDVLVL